jgi:hypothetical protein
MKSIFPRAVEIEAHAFATLADTGGCSAASAPCLRATESVRPDLATRRPRPRHSLSREVEKEAVGVSSAILKFES